jgi:hypothetical protein
MDRPAATSFSRRSARGEGPAGYLWWKKPSVRRRTPPAASKTANPKTSKLFTNQEREAIERVVRGNAVNNLAKLAGMFGFNIGGSGSANVVGGSLGLLLGGPVGFAVGAGSRKLSEKLTGAAAERAAKVVATPNNPQLPPRSMPPALLPPAVLPLEVTKKREPLQITVRGGANT